MKRRKVIEIVEDLYWSIYATAILECGHKTEVHRVKHYPETWPKTVRCNKCVHVRAVADGK